MSTTDTKSFKAFASKPLAVDVAKRTVRAYVTKQTLDEDGEVLLARGCDLSRFKSSPTVFINHQYDPKSVLGSASDIVMADDGIVSTTHFATRPPTLPSDQEWLPDTLLHYCAEGHLKGWSVGFTTDEHRAPTKKDLADYGDGTRKVTTRWKLLEYSLAPLQCNGDAVTLDHEDAYAKGLISKSLYDGLKAGRPFGKAVESEPQKTEPEATKVVADPDPQKAADTVAAEANPIIEEHVIVSEKTLSAIYEKSSKTRSEWLVLIDPETDPITEAATRAVKRARGELFH